MGDQMQNVMTLDVRKDNRDCRKGSALAVFFLICFLSAGFGQERSTEWNRFRGPNGSGEIEAGNLPLAFDSQQNLIWKRALPQGHSSPILSGNSLFVTGFEDDRLLVYCFDATSGNLRWEWEAQRRHEEKWDHRNNPASPSPVSDGNLVIVFFPEMGLIAFNMSGEEQWQLPLGPFNNIYGMGASPIIVGDKVILVCDQSIGSYIIAVDKHSGEIAWRTERPEAKSGHSTPIVYTCCFR